MFPNRSYGSITDRANFFGIYRERRIYIGDNRDTLQLHKNFSLLDCQVIDKFKLPAEIVVGWRKAVVALRNRRTAGKAIWIHPLDDGT